MLLLFHLSRLPGDHVMENCLMPACQSTSVVQESAGLFKSSELAVI